MCRWRSERCSLSFALSFTIPIAIVAMVSAVLAILAVLSFVIVKLSVILAMVMRMYKIWAIFIAISLKLSIRTFKPPDSFIGQPTS
jgi:hypothetical protein